MRRVLATTGAVAFVLVSAMGAGPASAGVSYHRCAGGANPDGSAGDFYRGIRAHHVSCRRARAVVRSFAYHHSGGEGVPRIHSTTTRFGGWLCHSKFHRTADNGYENVTCSRGGRAHLVRFFGAP